MAVRQARWFAILLLVLGGVLAALRLWIFLLSGEFDPTSLLSLLLVAIGILALVKPTLVYENRVLEVRNLIGMTMRRHGIGELSVEREGGRRMLFVELPGRRRRRVIAAPPVLHERAEAAAMMDAIEADLKA